MLRPLRFGTVALRRSDPRIIAPFTDRSRPASLRAGVKRGLALLEARVDLFGSLETSHVVSSVSKVRNIAPVLGTVRSGAEGGAWKRSERERLALYRALAPHVDALDIELDARIRRDVVRVARRARRPVVLSHHDFRKTPSASRLDDVVLRSAKAGADVIKIATFVKSAADIQKLGRLLARHSGLPLVVIGMGARGQITRVLFPALGSLFTFATLEKKTAPGQLGLAETVRGLKKQRALLR